MVGSDETAPLNITVAGYPFDRVQGLGSAIPVDGCEARFQKAAIGDMNSQAFGGAQAWEVTEIGLLPFLIAWVNDGFLDYELIPVFPLRVFRHKSIFIRTDKGIATPEDLRGKRVGASGYSTTSLAWIRGMFEHEYGVKPEEIQWVLSTDDSSADVTGERSAQELMLPDNLHIRYGTPGKSESELLVDDEVDALFHAAEPEAFVKGDPIVGRLFADSRSEEQAYFAKTGIFPIMHAVAIRSDVVQANPWLPESIFRAYAAAKQQALKRLRTLGWAMISLPWVAQEEEATRHLMGDDYWPYGIEANRASLESLLQYSYEQGLTQRVPLLEELFHPSTLNLNG